MVEDGYIEIRTETGGRAEAKLVDGWLRLRRLDGTGWAGLHMTDLAVESLGLVQSWVHEAVIREAGQSKEDMLHAQAEQSRLSGIVADQIDRIRELEGQLGDAQRTLAEVQAEEDESVLVLRADNQRLRNEAIRFKCFYRDEKGLAAVLKSSLDKAEEGLKRIRALFSEASRSNRTTVTLAELAEAIDGRKPFKFPLGETVLGILPDGEELELYTFKSGRIIDERGNEWTPGEAQSAFERLELLH